MSLAAAGLLPIAFGADNAPVLAAVGSVPHDALDREGETLGGFGSGLTYDATANRWLAVADRGPGDGAIDYRPRYQTFRLERRLGAASGQMKVTLESTTLFRDGAGRPFSGHSPDAAAGGEDGLPRFEGRVCLDPEAIALAPDGTLYIGEEYGPSVCQFARDGRLLRRLAAPDAYLPKDAAGHLTFGEDAVVGRVPNHGFEGLAISPDGARVTALLQGPLVQDGGRLGGVSRLLAFNTASGKPCGEYGYAFESSAAADARLGLSSADRLKAGEIQGCELMAVDDHRFLLLERDGRGWDGRRKGPPAAAKSVWLVDIAGATDLLTHPMPSPLTLSPEWNLPRKTLLLDLAASRWRQLAPSWPGLAAKWEGLALRRVGGDTWTLLVSSDNDFLTPILHLDGRDIPFPKARDGADTQLLLFTLHLPSP